MKLNHQQKLFLCSSVDNFYIAGSVSSPESMETSPTPAPDFPEGKTLKTRLIKYHYTVKPPNKGHIGDAVGPVVPCREVVLFSEVFF